MKIFTLEPTGYLGRSLAQRVLEHGHQVVGPAKDAPISEVIAGLLHPEVGALVLDLQAPGREQDVLTILQALAAAPLAETHPAGYTVLGVGTVLTWNATQKSSKKSNKESAYRTRRCSPRYKTTRYLEGLVLSAAREGVLTSMVVAPGVLYGNGEADLHYLYKAAWMHAGEPDFEGLPLIGDGKNIIPTIHVFDLCAIVRMLLESPPVDQQYFVAVDSGHTSQKALVTAIAGGLSEGKLRSVDKLDEKVLLAASVAAGGVFAVDEVGATAAAGTAAGVSSPPAAAAAASAAPAASAECAASSIAAANSVTNGNPEIILCDMKFESDYMAGLTMEWVCEHGPAAPEAFEPLRLEFVKARNLKPVRIMVAGAPGSGKSMYSALIASQYYVPHVQLGRVLQEALEAKDELAERLAAALADSATKLKATKKAKEKAKSTSAGKAKKGPKGDASTGPVDLTQFDTDVPRLPAYLLCKVVKAYLRRPLARNKGFVLDGFPRTVEESRWFFSPDVEEDAETGEPLTKIEDRRAIAAAAAAAGEEEEELMAGEVPEPQPRDPTTMVDSIVVLGCSEALAGDRLKRLPQGDLLPNHNDEEGFRRRWARYAAIHELNPLGLPAVPGAAEPALSALTFVSETVEVLDLPEAKCADVPAAIQLITLYALSKRGAVANYHPTEAEQSAAADVQAASAAREAEAAAATARSQVLAESTSRAAASSNHALRRAAVLLEDAMLIEASSAPIRSYLMEHVIPALVDGLLDVCKVQPEDPIDYLAEHLMKVACQAPEGGAQA